MLNFESDKIAEKKTATAELERERALECSFCIDLFGKPHDVDATDVAIDANKCVNDLRMPH